MGEDGSKLEPYEEAVAEVPEEFVGAVVDLLGSRKGQMMDLQTSEAGLSRIKYLIPTRYIPHLSHHCHAITAAHVHVYSSAHGGNMFLQRCCDM